MMTSLTATQEDYQRLIEIGESVLPNTNVHWHEIPVDTILHEPVEALTFTEEAAWLSRPTMKKRGTLQDACQVLASRDSDQLTIALAVLLREHKMKASQGGIQLPDGLICFPGAAPPILAREQGLRVDVTSPFIPAVLLD